MWCKCLTSKADQYPGYANETVQACAICCTVADMPGPGAKRTDDDKCVVTERIIVPFDSVLVV